MSHDPIHNWLDMVATKIMGGNKRKKQQEQDKRQHRNYDDNGNTIDRSGRASPSGELQPIRSVSPDPLRPNPALLGFSGRLSRAHSGPAGTLSPGDPSLFPRGHVHRPLLSSYTTRREFNLPGGFQLAIRQSSSSARSSRDHLSFRNRPTELRDRLSIYDPKPSRRTFSRPRSSGSVPSDRGREREKGGEPKASSEHHRSRRRKSSHPKEFSRNRGGKRDEDIKPPESLIPLPESLVGKGILGRHGKRERERKKEAERFEADKERLRKESKWLEEKDRKNQRAAEKEDRINAKRLEEKDDKKQKRFEKADKERQRQIEAEQANSGARLARKQMEGEMAGRRRGREAAEAATLLTEANSRESTDSGSKLRNSVTSELNREIGNMNRTILEGMLPAEEILREEKRRREATFGQRKRR